MADAAASGSVQSPNEWIGGKVARDIANPEGEDPAIPPLHLKYTLL